MLHKFSAAHLCFLFCPYQKVNVVFHQIGWLAKSEWAANSINMKKWISIARSENTGCRYKVRLVTWMRFFFYYYKISISLCGKQTYHSCTLILICALKAEWVGSPDKFIPWQSGSLVYVPVTVVFLMLSFKNCTAILHSKQIRCTPSIQTTKLKHFSHCSLNRHFNLP